MPAKVQKRQNTVLRQKQIVQAAQKVILKYGSENVTVKRIAKEVGISEGDIYRHFKSKRDILFLLADHIEQNLLSDFELPSPANTSPLDNLGNVLRNHLSAVAQRKGVSFQVIAEIISLGDKELNRRVSGTITKYTSRVRDILSEGATVGEIRADVDLDAAALLFFGMVQGVVNVWTLSNRASGLEQRYEPLWGLFREAVIKH